VKTPPTTGFAVDAPFTMVRSGSCGVAVAVADAVGVRVGVDVAVGVSVAVLVGVLVAVADGVGVDVFVGPTPVPATRWATAAGCSAPPTLGVTSVLTARTIRPSAATSNSRACDADTVSPSELDTPRGREVPDRDQDDTAGNTMSIVP
jgi:hypothetical protein